MFIFRLAPSHRGRIRRIRDLTPGHHAEEMAASMESRVNELDFSISFPSKNKAILNLALSIGPSKLTHVEKELSVLGQLLQTPARLSAFVSESVKTFCTFLSACRHIYLA